MSVRPLTVELQKIAEKELNEVSDRIPQDLEHIREWLLKQPHIKARMEAQWLIIFLRSAKFSLERTKEKLDLFYVAKGIVPEALCNRDPFEEKIQEILNTRFIVVLPDTLQYTKPRTILVTAENLNPDIHIVYDIWKTASMILDMYFAEEDTFSVNGIQGVIDLKNVNYNYVRQLTPSLLKAVATVTQKGFPVRIKKVVFINANAWLVKVWSAFRLLLSKKLQERFILCDADNGNSANGYSIPNMIKEFCGKDTTWDELAIELKCKLEKFRNWFLEDDQFGTDETKRPEEKKIFQDFYHGGLQGAFRNLDID